MRQRKSDKPGDVEKLGSRLLALMHAHEPVIRQARLARDMNVSSTTVQRWFRQLDDGGLDEESWAKIATALQTYNIDAREMRPVRVTVPGAVIDASLLVHLDLFESKEALEALVAILDGTTSPAARELLLIVARDRLRRQ